MDKSPCGKTRGKTEISEVRRLERFELFVSSSEYALIYATYLERTGPIVLQIEAYNQELP